MNYLELEIVFWLILLIYFGVRFNKKKKKEFKQEY